MRASSLIVLGSLAVPALAAGQPAPDWSTVRSFDFSTGLLPQQQGWGSAFPTALTAQTRGNNPNPPYFSGGALCSDSAGMPVSGTGHQWWFEWSPLACVFQTSDGYVGTGAWLEFEAHIISSTYAQSGSHRRVGFLAGLADWWNLAQIELFDAGFYVNEGPIQAFDPTDGFHTYRLQVGPSSIDVYVDGVYLTSQPYGPTHPWSQGHPLAVFGDSQGLLNVSGHFCMRRLEFGCVPDSDWDGVPDDQDAFPCDGSATSAAFGPAEDRFGMVIFEDQWPSAGDLDFNDAVVAYNYVLRQNAQGQTVGLRATFDALALGGIHDNGLGLHLPVPRSQVAAVTRSVGGGPASALVPSAADAELTVTLSNNLRELFGGQAGQINSLSTLPRLNGAPMVVEVTFTAPVALGVAGAPYDLFIFRTADPSHEIHRPEFGGTAQMNAALFGTGDDASTPGRRFVDTDGLPFALVFPELAPYPAEAVPISSLFPNIVPFAASGGATNQDFYVTGIVPAFAYADVAGLPRPDPAPVTASAVDLSCRYSQP